MYLPAPGREDISKLLALQSRDSTPGLVTNSRVTPGGSRAGRTKDDDDGMENLDDEVGHTGLMLYKGSMSLKNQCHLVSGTEI